MRLRVALFTSYGGGHCPKELEDKVKNSGKHWRVALAECIEELECNCDDLTQKIYDDFKRNDTGSWYLKWNSHFYYKDKENNTVRKIRLALVDISKKWKIEEYDGAESIYYFREPVLVDKELNMYR
ncbi:hypothetical protein ACEE21_15405 [Clostridium baratii]